MMRSIPTYPLNFRRLQLSLTSRRAPIANGYSTRYSEIVNCSAKMDATVSVYRRKTDLIAVATGRTTMGVGFETGPAITLPMDTSSNRVGQEVIKLFDACGATVKHPKTFGGPESPVLQEARCSRWPDFMRSRPDHITVTRTDAFIRVEFWRRDGRGFAPANPPDTVVLDYDAPPEHLGNVLVGRSKKDNAEQAAS